MENDTVKDYVKEHNDRVQAAIYNHWISPFPVNAPNSPWYDPTSLPSTPIQPYQPYLPTNLPPAAIGNDPTIMQMQRDILEIKLALLDMTTSLKEIRNFLRLIDES